MAYDEARDEVVLFGGRVMTNTTSWTTLDSTYAWNGSDWSVRTPAQQPVARFHHEMVYDPIRQRIVLFGGQGPNGGILDDTWEWDGLNWTRILPTHKPPARQSHSMAWHPIRETVLLFGGEDNTRKRDFWEFDGTTWLPIFALSPPPARTNSAMFFDHSTQGVVIFGGVQDVAPGFSQGVQADNTWLWQQGAWTELLPLGSSNSPEIGARCPLPGPDRRIASVDTLRNRAIVHSGMTSSLLVGRAVYEYGGDWRAPRPTSIAMVRNAAAFDSMRGEVVSFGGRRANSFTLQVDETWIYSPQIPDLASATSYGNGCGTPPLLSTVTASNRPVLGQTSTMGITNAPTALGAVALGWSNTDYLGFQLPVTLAGLNMSGCSLLHSSELTGLPATPVAAGQLQATVSIPNTLNIIGLRFYTQAYAFAPGANTRGVIVSNGVNWRIGDA
ncbi:MAG: Kelch repeat-containing protein [Planctomycetota bacterium]